MKSVNIPKNENVLVGTETADDAGVYKLTNDTALVQTVDYITPIVDDPFTYGRIAACNSLSDVYVMGGKPLTALNIVCFPVSKFKLDVLTEILKGGLSVLKEAGVQLLGGHSVEDNEMKYGLSVTGIVHPDKILRNTGLRDGDVIILTKPLGTGMIGTAVKADMCKPEFFKEYIRWMTTLNSVIPQLAEKFEIHACTDVTGFGLIGHLKEMIGADNFTVDVDTKSIPVLPGAKECAESGMIPAGMYRNRSYIGSMCEINQSVPQYMADIIFDPQTSGGALVSISKDDTFSVLEFLKENGFENSNIVAEVKKSDAQKIRALY
jgi:selenide, water dikinase